MSLFKKLFSGSEPAPAQQAGATAAPAAASKLTGIQAMRQDLQKKFGRGVNYNMKVIIKGDRNVGKSTMWRRLQGEKFTEEYMPTEQIQVASISWSYKVTDDIVKVEVWDVVDKGKKRKKPSANLKLTDTIASRKNTGNSQTNGTNETADNNSADADADDSGPVLDAEWVDVYKGTHAVFLLFDITKSWTFAYVEQELARIPSHIPVLVLANHRDMGHHRTVTEEQARYAIEALDRRPGSAPVRYAEMSLRNGFGLRYVYQFLNLPYLLLQRETLLRAVETNARDVEASIEELDALDESEASDYSNFADALSQQRRVTQDQLGAEAIKKERERQAAAAAAAAATAAATGTAAQPQRANEPPPGPARLQPVASAPPAQRIIAPGTIPVTPKPVASPAPAPESAPAAVSTLPDAKVKSSGKDAGKLKQEATVPVRKLDTGVKQNSGGAVVDIDNFVAETDGGELNDFLDDEPKAKVKTTIVSNATGVKQVDSDDEVPDRPVIQAVTEDFDPEDAVVFKEAMKPVSTQPEPLSEASSDKEDEEVGAAEDEERPQQSTPKQLDSNRPFRLGDAFGFGGQLERTDSVNSVEAPAAPVLAFDASELDALEALGKTPGTPAPAPVADESNEPSTRKPKSKTAATKKSKAKVNELVSAVVEDIDGEVPKPKPAGKKTTKKADASKRKPKASKNAPNDYDEL